jgi:RNA polymerase sigma-70 factor (ECF subfamily)
MKRGEGKVRDVQVKEGTLRDSIPTDIPTQGGGLVDSGQTILEVFEALESPLLAYAVRLLKDKSLAEDVVQEAFMKLQPLFKEVRQPRAWLYRSVHNLALNHLRQSAKFVVLPSAGQEEGGPELADPHLLPDEAISRLEGISLVRVTVEGLDERARELVRLKFEEDLSYKEISERTGLTVSHVGYLLHHAVKEVGGALAKIGLIP